ncbi:hypothetical protein [Kitasatospora aureofaciens]|uniref:hypothetical protein n=1 Tax=Kitasatospora aureofaciens TaxID=1894 RepID=UPI001C47F670|nr:hypothetical protein [Kitasatospora aureofaciens]MBV6701890.1 hypothetical protein [Kitasatospora aureofaciens]
MATERAEPRELIAALLAEGAESLPGLPALPVPPAAAAEDVIAVARRLALDGLPPGRWRPVSSPGLLRLAEALVVDEHPSAPGWTPEERERVTTWVAVLIEHRGEDGVQDLIRALDEGRNAA